MATKNLTITDRAGGKHKVQLIEREDGRLTLVVANEIAGWIEELGPRGWRTSDASMFYRSRKEAATRLTTSFLERKRSQQREDAWNNRPLRERAEDLLENIRARLTFKQKTAVADREKILSDFQTQLIHEMRWNGGKLIRAEVWAAWTKHFLELLDKNHNAEKDLLDATSLFQHFDDDAKRVAILEASRTGGSTSAWTNLTEAEERAAKLEIGEFLRDMVSGERFEKTLADARSSQA